MKDEIECDAASEIFCIVLVAKDCAGARGDVGAGEIDIDVDYAAHDVSRDLMDQ